MKKTLWRLWFINVVMFLAGCSTTITQDIKTGTTPSASVDGNTSGVVAELPNHARLVDATWVERYKKNISEGWGKYCEPELTAPDGLTPMGKYWRVDLQHWNAFILMRDTKANAIGGV